MDGGEGLHSPFASPPASGHGTALLPTDSVAAGQLVTREELVGVGSTVDDLISLGGSLGGSEYFGVEDEFEDDVSLVWEDPEVDGVGMENELQEVVTHTQEPGVVVSPSGVEDSSPGVEVSPSDWVLGKSKRIGKVLGASYHGNEERINCLLMEIDGRRPPISCEVGGVKKLKEGRKDWGIHHVDWLYLGSEGASGGISGGIQECASWWGVPCQQWATTLGGFFNDFNVVRFPSERLGITKRRILLQLCMGSQLDFGSLLVGCGNSDPSRLTYSKMKAIWRIDRFILYSDEDGIRWIFSSLSIRIMQKRLPSQILSDHFPIILDTVDEWDDFSSIKSCKRDLPQIRLGEHVAPLSRRVQGEGQGVETGTRIFSDGTPGYIMACKLKALKVDLKKWNDGVDKSEEGCDKLKADLKVDLKKWNLLEESLVVADLRPLTEVENQKRLTNFYSHLFEEEEGDRPLLDGLDFSMILAEDALWLERPFDEEEVAGVVAGFNGDKAPGPAGFSMGFFQCCWDILNPDVMAVLNYFHGLSSFEKSLNATFVSLIPKKTDALEVKDFRPISLVGSTYKILAKLLANRLKVVLPKIISASQNAFVQGRQILDSVLIASECLDSRLKSGDPGVLCKLDVDKAYDHVNWGFLSYLLQRCGFSRAKTRISPISAPICHCDGSFEPFVRSGDDTLIFCGADSEQISNLRYVFTWFEAVSGLKINLSKSKIVPVGDVPHLEELVQLLGCKQSVLPMQYLGLPLGATFKETAIWNPVLERVEKRLGSWKRLYLSKGGKVTLIKSTLSSIPTYFLSLFPIPARVANRLEKLQRDFLWCGMDETPKFHLVNWSQICTPLRTGGLAIRNLRSFNKALLGKWLWRYGLEREALWTLVVDAKYGSLWGGWCSKSGTGSYGVSVWKFIRRGWDTFHSHCSFLVGDGQRVKFWQDWWCGDRVLNAVFPELFTISQDKEASVADLMSFPNGRLHWDFHFVRNVNDWELESLTSFMNLLYSCHMEGVGEDRMGWRNRATKGFTVKNFYSCLCPSHSASFPWKSIWKVKVSPRIAFFSWTVALGNLLTIDNLRQHNLIIIDWCCLCKQSGGSLDHLLLHCSLARELWSMVFGLFGVSWVMPCHVLHLWAGWQSIVVSKFSVVSLYTPSILVVLTPTQLTIAMEYAASYFPCKSLESWLDACVMSSLKVFEEMPKPKFSSPKLFRFVWVLNLSLVVLM
uniref:Reverse transcriptase domain-containing protein n=1 Tax=Fagus sylvatica TaxID=28930 RepID=A0A2N9IHU7_FAGSY